MYYYFFFYIFGKFIDTILSFVCLVLRNAFNAFESSERKGFIPTEDLPTIIEMLGHRLNDQQQKQATREADPRNSGFLEFENFACYASKYVDVEEDLEAIAKELREAFLLYDRDCNLLTFHEIELENRTKIEM